MESWNLQCWYVSRLQYLIFCLTECQIAILYCLGSIDDALATPTGFPFIEIFLQATNSRGGATVMTSIVMLLMAAASIGVMVTASRMLWAFTRDNGVPFSNQIGRVRSYS